jgi:adenylylsulfate kinase
MSSYTTRGAVVWLTGLPCSGKTTISQRLAERLRAGALAVELLDGDVIRTNLSKGLGFSKEDRDTNVRRVGFVCNLLSRNGVVAVAAMVSPYRSIRDELRKTLHRFVEVYVNCPIEACRARDVKGMYARALRGEISGFTGVDDPYEPPERPEIELLTASETVEQSTERLIAALLACGALTASASSR